MSNDVAGEEELLAASKGQACNPCGSVDANGNTDTDTVDGEGLVIDAAVEDRLLGLDACTSLQADRCKRIQVLQEQVGPSSSNEDQCQSKTSNASISTTENENERNAGTEDRDEELAEIPFGGLTIATYEQQVDELEEQAGRTTDAAQILDIEPATDAMLCDTPSPNGVELTIDEGVDRDHMLFEEIGIEPSENGTGSIAPFQTSSQREMNGDEPPRFGLQSQRIEADACSTSTSQRDLAGDYDSDAFFTQYAGDRFESATPTGSIAELTAAGAKRTVEVGRAAHEKDSKRARVNKLNNDEAINLADDENETETDEDTRTRAQRQVHKSASRSSATFRVPHSVTLNNGPRSGMRPPTTATVFDGSSISASEASANEAATTRTGPRADKEKEKKPKLSGTVPQFDANAENPIEISDSDSEGEDNKADVQLVGVTGGRLRPSTTALKKSLNVAAGGDSKVIREVKNGVLIGTSSQFGSTNSLTSLSSIDPASLTRSVLEQHVRVIRDLSKRRVMQHALTRFLALAKLPAPNDVAASWIREAIDTAAVDIFECLLASNQHATIIKTLSFLHQRARMTDKCFQVLSRFDVAQKDAIIREKQSLLLILNGELDTVSFSVSSLRRLFIILRVLLFAGLVDAAWRIINECGAKMIESRVMDPETLDRLVAVTSQTASLDILQSASRFLSRLPPDSLVCIAPQSFSNLENVAQRYAPSLVKDVAKLAEGANCYRNRLFVHKSSSNGANGDNFTASTSRFPFAAARHDNAPEVLPEQHMVISEDRPGVSRGFSSASFRLYTRVNEAKALAAHNRFEQLASLFSDLVCVRRFDPEEYDAFVDVLVNALRILFTKDTSGVHRVLSTVRNLFAELMRLNTLAQAYDASAKMWFRLIDFAVELGSVRFIEVLYEIGSQYFNGAASQGFVPQLNAVYRSVFERLLRSQPPVIETFLEMQKSTPLLNGLVIQPTVIRRLLTHCVNIELPAIKDRMQQMKDQARTIGLQTNRFRQPYSKALHFLYEWATKANIYPHMITLKSKELNDRYVMRIYNDLTAEETFVVLCEYLSRYYNTSQKNDLTEVLVVVDYIGRQRDKQIDCQPMLIRPDRTIGSFAPDDYRLNAVLNLRILLADSRFVKSEADLRYAIRSNFLPDAQPSLFFLPAKLYFNRDCEPFRSGAVLCNDPMER